MRNHTADCCACHRSEAPIPRKELFHGLLRAFGGPSQCPTRNIYSDDVPFKFSENDALNPELLGACGVMEAITSYEKDVGFSHLTCPTVEPHELDLFTRVDLSIDFDELTYWPEDKGGKNWWTI